MSRKIPVFVVCVAALAGFVLGSLFSGPVHAESRFLAKLHVFNDILRNIDKNYVEEVDPETLVDGAIQGMLEELDPHTTYVETRDFERMTERNTGEYEGIGISFQILDGWITVISAIEGGPSAHLGIRPGDQIATIEGESAKDLTSEQVVSKLKGPKGTKVNIAVRRPGIESLFDFTIVRDTIPLVSIPYAFMMDDNKTGYVRAIRFSATTGQELEEALNTLERQGMKQLVLDLRGNTGGYLNQAIEVADKFISGDELIVYTKGRIPGSSNEYPSTYGSTHPFFPLIVLVNHGSASASEIVSGAVQDHDRGLIIGQTTFGKGLVQRQFSLEDGSALLLTVARYYTPTGRLIQRSYADRDEYLEHFRNADSDSVVAKNLDDLPQFKTIHKKRTVYGGGGITPDHTITSEFDLTPTQSRLEQFRTFFDFANEYAAKNFKAKPDQKEFFSNWTLDNASFADFKVMALADDTIELTAQELDQERDYISSGIKRELAGNLWGQEARYRVIIEMDDVLGKALKYFPEAAGMARLYSDVTQK